MAINLCITYTEVVAVVGGWILYRQMSSYRSIPWKQWTSAPCGASVNYFQGMERYSDILLYRVFMEHIIILVVLPAVVWLPKPMTAKDTMKKSDPLVASFCAICNAMCSRHKYCKLIKQAKSGDMQFMHVIIAVTDTTHKTILYKKRGVNCRHGSRNFRQGSKLSLNFEKQKKKKRGEKTKEKEDFVVVLSLL